MTREYCPPQSQNGFTLMEIVISLVLLGILGAVGTTMLSGSFVTTQVITNEHLAYASARYAMERMGREIREISYDTTTHDLGISTMTASQLSLTKSGLGGTTNVTIAYAAPQILLTTAAGSGVLAQDISAFALIYLDASRQPTTVVNDVRFVRISMTTSAPQTQPLTLVTQVSLKNP